MQILLELEREIQCLFYAPVTTKKMKNEYLIRLDDACPTMDAKKWQRIEIILDAAGIRPMVGIIPHNEDPQTTSNPYDEEFWVKAHNWEKKGWAIALHGYNHVCITNDGMKGMNPMWRRSEFAGLDYNKQYQKIMDGYIILKEHGIEPKYFFAPSHTFDENTLEALKACTPIRIISDTIVTKPYRKGDFAFIPQLGGHCTAMPISGIWTFCLHPNVMSDAQFKAVENFFDVHKDRFISFADLDLVNLKSKDLFSRLLSWVYFTSRKIRGLR